MNRQLLSGTPEDVRCTMEDLARDQDDHEYLDDARFRQLAVQLATRDDLAVSAVTSDDGAVYELEVTLCQRTAPRCDRHRPQPARRSLPDDVGAMAPHQRRTRR
jgi:hypothetical protein